MNTNNEKITAITVTFNRTGTLKKCIAALLSQTRAVDDIIIVDNHSKPEERAILDDLVKKDKRIHLHVLPDNMGGAGGFEAGMRLASERYPADWYWVMDDDAYPRPDCLEKLLLARDEIVVCGGDIAEADNADKSTKKQKISPYKYKKERIGFLAPLIYGVDLKKYQLYHHKYLKGRALDSVPIAENYEELLIYNMVDANAFVGPLISKDAVKNVGIADGSLFIYGDDTEYTYRVTRQFEGIMVRDAIIDHQDPPFVGDNYLQPKGWWKEYYSNRNRIFLITKFQKKLSDRFFGYAEIIYQITGLAAAAIIKPKYRNYHILRAALLMQSLKDGLMNNRGKNIDPGKYAELIKKKAQKK